MNLALVGVKLFKGKLTDFCFKTLTITINVHDDIFLV